MSNIDNKKQQKFSPLELGKMILEDVIEVARYYRPVKLLDRTDPTQAKAIRAIEKSADWVTTAMEEIEQSDNPTAYYGINTGFGHMAGKDAFAAEDAKWLSRNLLLSHAVGFGDYLDEEVVRAAMLIRANSLVQGFSGVRVEVINTLVEMLNKRVYPAIPSRGSVGASGDLVPLSHLGLLVSRSPIDPDNPKDSGEAFIFNPKTEQYDLVSGKEAMEQVGISRLVLGAKEGLAFNNGASFSAALGVLALVDTENLVQNSEVCLAMTVEAMRGFRDAFFPQLHKARGLVGQIKCAQNVMKLIEGSNLVRGNLAHDVAKEDMPPQDIYSIRCAPQVLGAVRDTLKFIHTTLLTEINAATDNPLIFNTEPESDYYLERSCKSVSGGNFHGQPIAFAMDFLKIVASEIGNISDRRSFTLLMAEKRGLPSDLVEAKKQGLNSGLMIAQYAAASLVSENKTLAHPDSVDSIPTSANQEDHVSMSMNAALHARQIVRNVEDVMTIELLAATQALAFRERQGYLKDFGKGTKIAYEFLKDRLWSTDEQLENALTKDRVLYPDTRLLQQVIHNKELVDTVTSYINLS